MKKLSKKQLLIQNVQMDGSVNFQTNGDINVYPCPWEDEKQVTGGERVRYVPASRWMPTGVPE